MNDKELLNTITKGIDEALKRGFLVEVRKGQYKITKNGKNYVEELIKISEDKYFKQDLFDFFVNNHHLHLLDGEMNDIINFVNQHYPVDFLQCSDGELLNLFDKTINEMNRRKAAGVWVGSNDK